MKKPLAVVLSSAMLFGTVAGCNSQTPAPQTAQPSSGGSTSTSSEAPKGVDTSKEVALKMYLLGDKPADTNLIYEEVSKIMKEKINATISVEFLSWAEHDTKYSLLFSSGEDFDLIFTAAGWGHYEQTVSKKGFYELSEDFIQAYAPQTWETMPQAAWDQSKIDGKVYMVPNYQNEFGYNVLGVRGDLMEKYGIENIESLEELEAYFEAIAKNETSISPLATKGGELHYPVFLEGNGYNVLRGTPIGDGVLMGFDITDPTNTNVISLVESEDYLEYAKLMKMYADRGYWSMDSLFSTDERQTPFVTGKGAAMVWNIGSVARFVREVEESHPEWKPKIIDINPGMKKSVNPYTNNGMAINGMSKNPERAMMAIDLLRNDKEIFDLTWYGVEGVHYQAVGDNSFETLADSSKYPSASACPWGWANDPLLRRNVAEPPIVRQTTERWAAEDLVSHPLAAFSFNEEPVKSEVAAIANVTSQYMGPIEVGAVKDAEAAVQELIAKLKEAGYDKVYAEAQRQVTAYLAGLK